MANCNTHTLYSSSLSSPKMFLDELVPDFFAVVSVAPAPKSISSSSEFSSSLG